ncbi:hypothetical protein NDU88_007876 [Pleurodeles waltl]|uniref:Uncharacterized protein n=1 Tax=Pleurodeles waltl TaxID=8319 RepID=A0AAV7QN44_PLEWA|nr:hypothetical protein NDU88_007876 [Pleurodeles waltl]
MEDRLERHGGGGEQSQMVKCAAKPSLRDIMSAIQDLKGTLEPKLDTEMIDVGLLHADLGKISEKVTKAEENMNDLQATIKGMEE